MKRTAHEFLIAALLALGGCSGPVSILPTTPEQNQTFNAEYQKLAGCSYLEAERIVGAGVDKAELPAQRTTKVLLSSAGVNFWTLTFAEAGPKQTNVSFTVGRNMWGSDAGGANKIWDAVRKCAQA